MATLGETIQKLRKRENIKAKDLAKELNISSSYLSQYEHDIKKPPREQLQKIADILGYPISAFEDTEYDYVVAMHRQFQAYEKYVGIIETDETIKEKVANGTLEKGVYVSYKSLSAFMYTWFLKYDDMKNGVITEEEFQEWMDRYTETSEPNTIIQKVEKLYDKKMNEIDTITSNKKREDD